MVWPAFGRSDQKKKKILIFSLIFEIFCVTKDQIFENFKIFGKFPVFKNFESRLPYQVDDRSYQFWWIVNAKRLPCEHLGGWAQQERARLRDVACGSGEPVRPTRRPL